LKRRKNGGAEGAAVQPENFLKKIKNKGLQRGAAQKKKTKTKEKKG
jgi:hypothetical protein